MLLQDDNVTLGDGCICVLIPRRFNYPLHSMWLALQWGSLFNHDHTVYYVSLMWQVAINSFFFCWLLYHPLLSSFWGKKKYLLHTFLFQLNVTKSYYFWLFFCKEEYTVSLLFSNLSIKMTYNVIQIKAFSVSNPSTLLKLYYSWSPMTFLQSSLFLIHCIPCQAINVEQT